MYLSLILRSFILRMLFLKNHFSCAADPSVISKCCKNNLCIFAGWKCIFHIIFLNAVNQWLSGLGYPSTDYDCFRINNCCKTSKCSRQHTGCRCCRQAGAGAGGGPHSLPPLHDREHHQGLDVLPRHRRRHRQRGV